MLSGDAVLCLQVIFMLTHPFPPPKHNGMFCMHRNGTPALKCERAFKEAAQLDFLWSPAKWAIFRSDLNGERWYERDRSSNRKLKEQTQKAKVEQKVIEIYWGGFCSLFFHVLGSRINSAAATS